MKDAFYSIMHTNKNGEKCKPSGLCLYRYKSLC